MTLKESFKKSFPYTWYLYVVAIAIPCVAFPAAYSFAHRPQEFEKLNLFVSSVVSDSKLSDNIQSLFKDKGVKAVEVASFDPNDNEYLYIEKLNVVGLNKCDILVIPENRLNLINAKACMIELNEDIKSECNILDCDYYTVDNIDYGVKLTVNTPLKDYVSLNNGVNYYAFLGGKSWNVGSYSNKNPNSTNAFGLMQFIVGK